MAKYVAFLRGIMPMNPNMKGEKLRWMFEELGFSNVRTVIASGNVLFESRSKDHKALEMRIEKAFPELLGFNSTTIIRSKEEIDELVKKDPYKGLTASDKEKPNLTFFKNPPDKDKLPKDGYGFKGYDFISGAYCYTVDMTSIKTPEAMLTLEKLFGKEITTRTWGTVLKVHKLLSAA